MGELVLDDRLDPQLLTDVAKQYPLAVAQRAGWILEHMADQVGGHIDLEALHHAVSDAATTPLDPELPRVGDRDPRWRVCVNTDLEHDL